MNFFKLYIGDYQRDTAHLSVAEHGAYMLMLQHYYATEKPLPSGKALHRMLRAQDKTERDAIDLVTEQFWITTPEGLVNERADAEIAKASTQADTNARIAREREERRRAARNQHEPSTNRATNDQPNHSQTPEEKEEPPKPPAADASVSGKPDDARELLAYLNAKTGKHFRCVPASLDPIRARLKNATSEQVRAVIDDRVKAWASDEAMAKYLRPETLFRASKFEGYLGNLGAAKPGGRPGQIAGAVVDWSATEDA